MHLSTEWEDEKSKKYYDKYVPMLIIRDDHVDYHFNDKFVPLYHVGYFINDDRWKLMAKYIYCTFYIFRG